LFGSRPDINGWYLNLKEKYKEIIVYIFADFSRYSIEKSYIPDIEENFIDTKSSGKNMTDVIMLDYIYRVSPTIASTDIVVIFSGDRHFEVVVNYLTQSLNKEVIIYAIKGTLSQQLKIAASKFVELPTEYSKKYLCCRAIVNRIDNFEHKKRILRYPSYFDTIKAVSQQLDIQPNVVEGILNELLDKSYLYLEHDCVIGHQDSIVFLNETELIKNGFMNWDA
jgi:hypothetical protein